MEKVIINQCNTLLYNYTRGPVHKFMHGWSLGVACRDQAPACAPSLAALQPCLAPCSGLAPPPHLCSTMLPMGRSIGAALDAQLSQCLEAGWQPHPPPPPLLVTVYRVTGGAIGPPLTPTLAWCLLLICSHRPTTVPLSLGPIGAGSIFTAAHYQRHITDARHGLRHPLVVSAHHSKQSNSWFNSQSNDCPRGQFAY
uniref:Uncharacterized protein n=1 Tax=Myotis myotis TaxID=51298 RepID=A0A7J7TTN7_MYOMY|nr:hypothetical protein mMyoMyo1_008949 [Myotis myotis]